MNHKFFDELKQNAYRLNFICFVQENCRTIDIACPNALLFATAWFWQQNQWDNANTQQQWYGTHTNVLCDSSRMKNCVYVCANVLLLATHRIVSKLSNAFVHFVIFEQRDSLNREIQRTEIQIAWRLCSNWIMDFGICLI